MLADDIGLGEKIIASNLTPKKKEEFKRYRVVKPAWIVDSVNAGKLLPWDAYRVVDEGVGQKVLGFENGQVVSQVHQKARGYKEQTDTSWYTSQLKARDGGSEGVLRKLPSFTQTATPVEEIEEDEFPEPEITSSIERVLDGPVLEQDDVVDDEPPRDLFEVRTERETPPPSTPPLDLETAAHNDAAVTSPTPLRPRQGSQEPDYTTSLILNSPALNAVSPTKLATMTAEEHNALLLSDPRIRKSTVVHPDFLSQYYRESRLHHLSTWKASLKSQLQTLAAQTTASQKARTKGALKKLPGQRRYIMHVDFDSFFAAVSLKSHPAEYKDQPCVVAHGGGSGSEIASCNYPARAFGVSNGMWMRRAQVLCPELKVLPYDFPAYEEASRLFYACILDLGGVVQSVSIDEALVDISALCFAASGTDGVGRAEGAVHREQAKADELASRLREEVLEKAGCAVSVGIGGNVLQAKVALRKAKPAGQYQLKPEEVLEFIGALEVTRLPGVAWSLGGKLEEIGVKLVRDVREITKERLITTLGPKTGEKIWEYARGIDRAEVGDDVVRKSVSAEVNWGVRFENQDQVDEFMHGLCGELHKRLVKEGVKGKQLTLKVMRRAADAPRDPPKHLGHGKCDTVNKSLQLGVATNEVGVLAKEAVGMMRGFGVSPGELRGIGVQMQKLEAFRGKRVDEEEGSQRRLRFLVPAKPRVQGEGDEIVDAGGLGEEKPRRFADAHAPSVPVRAAVNASTPTKTRLNTLGTQFVLPTQVDPAVLAELPEEIRAKLFARGNVKPAPTTTTKTDEPLRVKPAAGLALALPNHSQLDPAILSALPEDVRAEVLAAYSNDNNSKKISPKRGEQALLPQSPRKSRTLPPTANTRLAVKRKRGGGLFAGKARSNLHNSAGAGGGETSTLTQSNFVARPAGKQKQKPDETGTDTEAPEGQPDQELDPEFLAALPEDIRREVLAQQRQSRLQRTGGIDLSLHQQRRRGTKGKQKGGDTYAPVLHLPPRAPLPTFTPRKLTALPEIREAIGAWVREFRDEGPYEEDVQALGVYLRAVIEEERDVGKAVAVVGWLGWVVDEDGAGGAEGWGEAVERVKGVVREAARARGMGEVEL